MLLGTYSGMRAAGVFPDTSEFGTSTGKPMDTPNSEEGLLNKSDRSGSEV